VRLVLRRLRFAAAIGAAGGALVFLSCLVSFLTGSVLAGGFTGILGGTWLTIKAFLVGGDLGDLDDDGLVLGLTAAIAASFAGFLGSVPLMELRRLTGREQREVSLAEVANHPDVARFRLRDGHVAAKDILTEYHRHPSKKNPRSYKHAVAPVLPPGWRPGEPVRVWAVCHDFVDSEKNECLETWRVPAGGAIVVNPEIEFCFQLAVPAQHAPSDGRLVFVHWVKSPEAYLEARWGESLGALKIIAIIWGVIAGLWLLGTTSARAVSRWRRSLSRR
jgi:hypothetical protein